MVASAFKRFRAGQAERQTVIQNVNPEKKPNRLWGFVKTVLMVTGLVAILFFVADVRGWWAGDVADTLTLDSPMPDELTHRNGNTIELGAPYGKAILTIAEGFGDTVRVSDEDGDAFDCLADGTNCVAVVTLPPRHDDDTAPAVVFTCKQPYLILGDDGLIDSWSCDGVNWTKKRG